MSRVIQRIAAALCLACIAMSVLAQDPRTTAVQSAARAWLAYVDRGDAPGAWGAGGKRFQSSLTKEAWAQELKKVQDRMGKPVRRTVGPTRFQSQIPGLPNGEYAQILFRTSFANKPEGRESLTLERDTDGKWRVIGYFPR